MQLWTHVEVRYMTENSAVGVRYISGLRQFTANSVRRKRIIYYYNNNPYYIQGFMSKNRNFQYENVSGHTLATKFVCNTLRASRDAETEDCFADIHTTRNTAEHW